MLYTDADEEVYMYVLYGGTKLASIIRPVPGTEK